MKKSRTIIGASDSQSVNITGRNNSNCGLLCGGKGMTITDACTDRQSTDFLDGASNCPTGL